MQFAPRYLAVLLVFLATSGAQAQTTQPTTRPGKTVRLLTVGNSFAGNSTKYLNSIVAAGGDRLVLGLANPGGCTLERHWKAVAAHEADPNDPAGLLYEVGPRGNAKKMSLKQMLTSQPWDYITIQQASPLSDDPATYDPFAAELHNYIRRHAPTATVLVHQTWAYRADHSRYAKGSTPAEMHKNVRAAYHALADRLKLGIIPVGDAMFAAMNDPTLAFVPDPNFDRATALPPALPKDKGGVHASYRWQKNKTSGKDEIVLDGTHANARGCYIGACVFYETLFGKAAIGNTYVPKELTPDDAAKLQQIAHEAVEKYRAAAATPPAAQ